MAVGRWCFVSFAIRGKRPAASNGIPFPTERLWLTGELMRTSRVPYSGTFTPYTAGMTAWVPMVQAVLAF